MNFCNIIFDLKLFQYINQPTDHNQGSMLDLILLDSGDLIHSL